MIRGVLIRLRPSPYGLRPRCSNHRNPTERIVLRVITCPAFDQAQSAVQRLKFLDT